LSELITARDQVVLGVRANERWELIDELLSHLAACGRLPGERQAGARAAVRDRESTMSTGIGHGIGIPHAAVPGLTEPAALLAVSGHDVDFDALDGAPVRLVILIVFPEDQTEQHLDTLADVARVLGSAEIRAALLGAAAPEAVLDILRGPGP
jgi:mannitol/fructose-specific phosphotransferase system IIA component (Ntr-type)